MNVIPKDVYRTIEGKLHAYEEMKMQIKEWKAKACSCQRTIEGVRGRGHYSDPTARMAIETAEPPKHIANMQKWIEIIDLTMKQAKRNGTYGIFEWWYGQVKKTPIQAARLMYVDKRTFYRYRDETVVYVALRAVQEGLVTL